MKLLNPIIALLATTVIAANMASAEGEFGYNVELDVAYGKGVVRSDPGWSNVICCWMFIPHRRTMQITQKLTLSRKRSGPQLFWYTEAGFNAVDGVRLLIPSLTQYIAGWRITRACSRPSATLLL